MRKTFETQLQLGCTPIEEVDIPLKTKSHLAALAAALQYIYVTPEWNQRIFALLSSKICGGKKRTGRKGMSLWEVFVLAQVRLCMNISYDELHHIANYDTLIRGIMGVLPTHYSVGKTYGYQNIYDNVNLLDDELLVAINDVIVEAGHEVFKKKGGTGGGEVALRCKTDSFVVETHTHFPTDYNLLWDACRKCLDMIEKLKKKRAFSGCRKFRDWRSVLKGLMRQVGRGSGGGGKNKAERLHQAVEAYLRKAGVLSKKVHLLLKAYPISSTTEFLILTALTHYLSLLDKHIDLLERRVLKGEKIPHEEKLFSIFQPYTEWITKGKTHPSVEIGKSLVVTSDQYDLIVDWQLAEGQSDNELTLPVARRMASKYPIQSLSTDRGFSDQEDKKELQSFIPEVIMPKKGRLNQQDKELEAAPAFRRLKNRHNAVESIINELEHRGLNRCPNRNRKTFNAYIALAITAYNLHKFGRKLQADQREAERLKQAA